MNILERLSQRLEWEQYYDHKLQQGNMSEKDAKDLYSFIANEEYLPVVQRIYREEPFPAQKKKLIGKAGVKKKRVV